MDNSFESFEPGEIDSAAAAPPENAAPDKLTQPELDAESSAGTARSSKSVAVVGGGLAGLAAAAVLSQRGLKVDLFEQSDRLGGRAGSFEEPWNGQIIDQCQHVAWAAARASSISAAAQASRIASSATRPCTSSARTEPARTSPRRLAARAPASLARFSCG